MTHYYTEGGPISGALKQLQELRLPGKKGKKLRFTDIKNISQLN
jgi:hypothetical protein